MWHRYSFTLTNRRKMGQILIGVDSSSAGPLCSRASSVSLLAVTTLSARLIRRRTYLTVMAKSPDL